MSKGPIDFSRPFEELFAGGGEFFTAGLYQVVRSRFVYFDFKKPGNDSLCLLQELQPLDEDRNPFGEVVTRYWGVGGKLPDGTVLIEPVNPVKGEKGAWSALQFTEANKHDTLPKTFEFGVFMEYAHKHEVDMDAVSNDITNFDDMVLEYGIIPVEQKAKKGKTAVEVAEGAAPVAAGGKTMKDVVIITSVPKKGKKGAAKKQKEEEADEPPAKGKGKGKGKKSDPDALILEYIEKEIVPEVKKDDEAGWMDHKLTCARWLKKERKDPLTDDLLTAEEVGAAMAIYNDIEGEDLGAILESVGLKLNKQKAFVTR